METVVCARCSTVNRVGVGLCENPKCQKFLPKNKVGQRSGIYAKQPPPADLQLAADELTSGIVSDLGGESELSTLQTAYVKKLADIDITIRLLTNDIAVNGLMTPGGRVRNVYDKLLAGLGAFDRYAQRLGLERRAKRVPSLSEVMNRDE